MTQFWVPKLRFNLESAWHWKAWPRLILLSVTVMNEDKFRNLATSLSNCV